MTIKGLHVNALIGEIGLCKHVFKIITTVGTWNTLSALVRQSQFLNVDDKCIDLKLIDKKWRKLFKVTACKSMINVTNIRRTIRSR